VAIAQTTYATNEGSETAALRALLESVDLAGVLAQADALHGNRPFFYLAEREADFQIAIKGSRRKGFRLIQDRLTIGKRVPFQTSDSQLGQGRDLTWTLRAMEAPEWVKANWPGSALIIAVRNVGTRDGRPVDETRYYATSLRTAPAALLRLIRQHWSIENSWHWVRDTQLDEDTHRYRERNGVQILATLRSMGLNTVRLAGLDSIANGMAALAHDFRHLLELLGWRRPEEGMPVPS
jgi:predicted transposase YbfD/YdcC